MRSVASFFVSRVDTEADRRLEELGNQKRSSSASSGSRTRGSRTSTSRGVRRAALGVPRGEGRPQQRPLWASTSTKNPAYRDVLYVEELIGPDTVNTMPPETIDAFQDHGEVRGDTVARASARRASCSTSSPRPGVDYDDVVETLEAEGVQKFADSFDELLDGIRAKQGELAAA